MTVVILVKTFLNMLVIVMSVDMLMVTTLVLCCLIFMSKMKMFLDM